MYEVGKCMLSRESIHMERKSVCEGSGEKYICSRRVCVQLWSENYTCMLSEESINICIWSERVCV